MVDKMKPQDSCLLSVLQACTLLLCRGELLGAMGAVQGSKTHRKKMAPVVIRRGNSVHYHVLWGMALSFSKLLESLGSS